MRSISFCIFGFLLTLVTCFLLAVSALAQLKSVPSLSKAYFDRGVAEFNKGDYDAAIISYTEYLKLRPDDPSGWFNRGIAHQQKAEKQVSRPEFELAAEDLSQAIKLNAKSTDYWVCRGQVYMQLMRVDFSRYRMASIGDFTHAITLSPRLGAAYRGRGQVYEDSNDPVKALADLNVAIQIDPKDAVALYTRSKIYGARNDFSAARTDLEAALRNAPDLDAARRYLEFINEQARKMPPQRQSAAVTPSVVQQVAPVTDPFEGYKAVERAEAAGNNSQVVDLATRAIGLIAMRAESEPRDDIHISVYMTLLRKRAKAYSALRRNDESDADYRSTGSAAMRNMNRFAAASNAQLASDRSGSGGGLIMASLESAKAVIVCRSGLEIGQEWIDTVKRTRPNDMTAGITAGINMSGIRGICVSSLLIHAGNQAGKASFNRNERVKYLNEAIATLTEAVQVMPSDARPLIERARIYRELGRADLAAADEATARTLPTPK